MCSRECRTARWLGRAAAALCCALLLVGCDNMSDQPRLHPQGESSFYPDGMAARPLPAGVVPHGFNAAKRDLYTQADEAYSTGMTDGKPVTDIPVPVTAALLARGQARFDIYCTPCHGKLGNGQGMIVQRGFPAPPTYHDDRLRQAPAGHFFDVMTRGFGKMQAYNVPVSVPDRWAIVAYIRALQLSQHETLAALPADVRQAAEAELGPTGGPTSGGGAAGEDKP